MDQQYPVGLSLLVFQHCPQVQEVQDCLFHPLLHQAQEYLFVLEDQLDQQDPCGQGHPLDPACQVVPQGQKDQAPLSFLVVQPFQMDLFLQGNLLILFDPHFPSCLGVPAFQLLHLCLILHSFLVVLAFLGILWLQENPPCLSLQLVQSVQEALADLLLHPCQDLL